MKEINGIPRRYQLNLNTDAEKAIRAAKKEVEKLSANEKLTDALILLQKAFEIVADFEDSE